MDTAIWTTASGVCPGGHRILRTPFLQCRPQSPGRLPTLEAKSVHSGGKLLTLKPGSFTPGWHFVNNYSASFGLISFSFFSRKR